MIKKSICFISPFIGPLLIKESDVGTGGAERQFFLFGKELSKRGWEVIFITQKVEGELVSDFFKVIWVDFSYLGGSKFLIFKSMTQLDRALKTSDADFYILKNAHTIFPSLFIQRFLRGGKIVFWGQTSSDFDKRKDREGIFLLLIRYYAIYRSDIIITQTKEQCIKLSRNYGREGHVVSSIIECENIKYSENLRQYVFWCGNTSRNKRPEVFIELARLNPSYHFVMALNNTSYERENYLRNLSKSVQNLKYLGPITINQVKQYFSEAFVLVNTSIREGFPNTYLQGWQAGVPVISVNIDPDKVITKNFLGICLFDDDKHLSLSDSEIAEMLSLALLKIVEKKGHYEKQCVEYVTRNHSPAKSCGELLASLSL